MSTKAISTYNLEIHTVTGTRQQWLSERVSLIAYHCTSTGSIASLCLSRCLKPELATYGSMSEVRQTSSWWLCVVFTFPLLLMISCCMLPGSFGIMCLYCAIRRRKRASDWSGWPQPRSRQWLYLSAEGKSTLSKQKCHEWPRGVFSDARTRCNNRQRRPLKCISGHLGLG